jgi:hypothetical protein
MNKKQPKPLSKIMEELKESDPDSFNEIETEVARRGEEIKKHGGYRPGAGRKRIYPNRVQITKNIPIETQKILKKFAKEHNISENEALNRLILEGYEKIKAS